MNRTWTIAGVIITVTVLCSSAALTAAPPTKTKAPPKAAPTKPAASATTSPQPKYASGVFDVAAPLPPNYAGNSIEAVYGKLVMVAPKGEFETTADYEKRRQSAAAGPYAFTLERTFPEYNADTQTMTVHLFPQPAWVGVGGDSSVLSYWSKIIPVGSRQYVATNAFGATVNVQSTSEDIYALLPNVGPLSAPYDITFKMSPEEAQKIKPNLATLMIVAPEKDQPAPIGVTSPWHGQNGFHSVEATFDSPQERITGYFLLRVQPLDVWVYDRATGKVLAKMSDDPHAGGVKLSVYGAENQDGYATVDVEGNSSLGLKRTFRRSGGGCQIRLGTSAEVVGMQGSTWTTSFVDLDARAHLVVRDANGATLFDAPFPSSYGSGLVTPWPQAAQAAQAMWSAAPGGTAAIENAGSKNAKTSLAGFRELWTWGTEQCTFSKLGE